MKVKPTIFSKTVIHSSLRQILSDSFILNIVGEDFGGLMIRRIRNKMTLSLYCHRYDGYNDEIVRRRIH